MRFYLMPCSAVWCARYFTREHATRAEIANLTSWFAVRSPTRRDARNSHVAYVSSLLETGGRTLFGPAVGGGIDCVDLDMLPHLPFVDGESLLDVDWTQATLIWRHTPVVPDLEDNHVEALFVSPAGEHFYTPLAGLPVLATVLANREDPSRAASSLDPVARLEARGWFIARNVAAAMARTLKSLREEAGDVEL